MTDHNPMATARLHNPFSLGLSTELLEEPSEYKRAFSERILVSETLAVFQQVNVILTGPQGTGKSMILNLLRYKVLNEFLAGENSLPKYLAQVPPFLGISINLTRAGFHAFGRRSIAKSFPGASPSLDVDCAADYLTQYVLKEFLTALHFLNSAKGSGLRQWLKIDDTSNMTDMARTIANWDCWSGFYSECQTIEALLVCCERRLNAWRVYLAGNPEFPNEIRSTLVPLAEPVHLMGNVLRSLDKERKLSLYVVIDQYEELIGLNAAHGSDLQRIVNTLIKARDPVVFYKMGVRTYDWGTELRVMGSDLKVEAQRDYVHIDLADVLVRTESTNSDMFSRDRRTRWLFAQFAEDVAVRRIQLEGRNDVSGDHVRRMFGPWKAQTEVQFYTKRARLQDLLKRSRLPEILQTDLAGRVKAGLGELDLHLAIAWCWQRLKRKESPEAVRDSLECEPWKRTWWRKERIEFALVQMASANYQRRTFFGWNTLLMLSGGNISAFLLMFSEVWDNLSKLDYAPLELKYIKPVLQNDAVYSASRKWVSRDRTDSDGGSERYAVLGKLGAAIRQSVINDKAISNPGHTGFSLRDSDLAKAVNQRIASFLGNGVKWGMFEIRNHRSKQKNDGPRHKWYLHPLLSPVFEIPFTRVKEPLYINDFRVLDDWFSTEGEIVFSSSGKKADAGRRRR